MRSSVRQPDRALRSPILRLAAVGLLFLLACRAVAPLPTTLADDEYRLVLVGTVEEINRITLTTSRLVAARADPRRNAILLAEAAAARDELASLLAGLPDPQVVPGQYRTTDAAVREALSYYVRGMDRLLSRANSPQPEDEEFFHLMQEAGKQMHRALGVG